MDGRPPTIEPDVAAATPEWPLGVAAAIPEAHRGWPATPDEKATPDKKLLRPPPERLNGLPEAFQGWCNHPWPSTMAG